MNPERSELNEVKEKPERKKYCDRQFKTQLAKALKVNLGEPENIDKIRSNKLLASYDSEKIIGFTNDLARDIQHSVEQSIESPRTREIIELAKNVDQLTADDKPHELPMIMKLQSVSRTPTQSLTNNVNFDALNRYLYSVMSGSLDYVEMNYETKLVLYDTYNMLMEQVEKDAPKVLEDLCSKMMSSSESAVDNNAPKLSEMLQSNGLNPFNIPFDLLLQNKTPKQ